MNKQKRIIIWVLYVLMCLIIESYIIWLFPFTGLGGLICWPLTIVLSLGFGFTIYRLTKRQLKNWQTIFLTLSTLFLQIYLQLWITPQDFGGSTLSKINDTFSAYRKYEQIQYTNFPNLTKAERVIYIYKFQNRLPESLINLQIESTNQEFETINKRNYIIENKAGVRHYDTSKLKLMESDSATIITEYRSNNDTIIYKMNRNFLNIKAGGWLDKGINLNINEDDFKFETGIEKLLYGILKRTKKAYR